MRYGNYLALTYGITDINENHLSKKKKEKFYDELHDVSEDLKCGGYYGIHTSYESGDNYVALFIAVSKTFLSEWWGVGFMEDCPIINMEEKINKSFKKEYNKAKRFWSKKIKPIMDKYEIKTFNNKTTDFVPSEPELNIIKDFD